MGRVAGRFARVELRQRARAFVRGLLADLPRKNCWTIAEHVGDPNPDGMQHLLARAVWDHDAVRDDVRAVVVEYLGDPEAVLVVDETGDLKRARDGWGAAPVHRHRGRIENAQVAVYLVYASRAGHAVVDRELYLPKGWADDPSACGLLGFPTRKGLRPSPSWPRPWTRRQPAAGAGERHGRPRAAGHPGGPRGRLRAGGSLRPPGPGRWRQPPCRRPAHPYPGAGLAAGLVWQGRQRPPLLRLGIHPPGPRHSPAPDDQAGQHWLLVRRSLTTGELAFYRCGRPGRCRWWPWSGSPGSSWRVEERFQAGKGLVRPGPAPGPPLALLVPLGDPGHAGLRVPGGGRGHRTRPPPTPLGLIALTCNEIQHLFAALVAAPSAEAGHRLRWSCGGAATGPRPCALPTTGRQALVASARRLQRRNRPLDQEDRHERPGQGDDA